MDLIQALAINAALSAACFMALWAISIAIKDVSFVDSYWAIGMVILAIASLIESGPPTPHRLALTLLVAVWGLRLGVHLFLRWRAHGADPRYSAMFAHAQTQRGWGFATSALLLVFALQAPLQFIVSLPVQLGQIGPAPPALGPIAWVGIALALTGIAFESIGDLQLTRFKANPANQGKVLQTGLWRLTRHPNYFGDACLWWGLFLVAAETPYGLWSLPGPVLLTVLLTRWSGVPTVEGRMKRRRPDYEAYVARTSGFIPWFPKKAS